MWPYLPCRITDCTNYKHCFNMCKVSQLAEDAFLVYGLLFYLCITGVLIVMFFNDLCFGAFICLVLLRNRLSLIPTFLHTWFFFYFYSLKPKTLELLLPKLISLTTKWVNTSVVWFFEFLNISESDTCQSQSL